MSQHKMAKEPLERSESIQKKNMLSITVNPELTKSYAKHEKDTQEHLRIHRDASLVRRSRIDYGDQGGKGGA
jgi:hypothetical protein